MNSQENQDTHEAKSYLVWYDRALSEIISVEKTHSTPALEFQLALEGIETMEVMAYSHKQANHNFNQQFSKLSFKHYIMQPSFDCEDVRNTYGQTQPAQCEDSPPALFNKLH